MTIKTLKPIYPWPHVRAQSRGILRLQYTPGPKPLIVVSDPGGNYIGALDPAQDNLVELLEYEYLSPGAAAAIAGAKTELETQLIIAKFSHDSSSIPSSILDGIDF